MANKKVSESVLNRSVIKLIDYRNDCIAAGPAVGQDCAVTDIGDRYVLTSTECALTKEKYAPYFAVMRAVNNIAACGGIPLTVSAAFILPEGFEEKELKALTRIVNEACRACGAPLSGGHTEICGDARSFMVSVTVTGICMKEKYLTLKNAKPGMAIVATKRIAIEKTAYLVTEKECRDKLLERLPVGYVEHADSVINEACAMRDADIAAHNGAVAMHDAAGGGIFTALLELSVGSRCGLNVDLRAVPVAQETIEFSEIFGINPYDEASTGCMLVVTDRPAHLMGALEGEGIPAAVIGYLTSDNDKKIVNGDEVRYLDKP